MNPIFFAVIILLAILVIYYLTRESHDDKNPHATHVVTPATHVVTPATHVVTPATHVVTPATHVVTPATHVVTPATHVSTPATHATPAVTHTTEYANLPKVRPLADLQADALAMCKANGVPPSRGCSNSCLATGTPEEQTSCIHYLKYCLPLGRDVESNYKPQLAQATTPAAISSLVDTVSTHPKFNPCMQTLKDMDVGYIMGPPLKLGCLHPDKVKILYNIVNSSPKLTPLLPKLNEVATKATCIGGSIAPPQK